ncbi:MAG: CvpA family protein [Candidatus Omnitrophica bacterium]|nr:CvpA family protein [Candidatus Omnitrophota bacterium]
MEIFHKIGIIDIIFLIIFFRIVYISILKGIAVEILKFIALIVALFFSFHYYSYLPKLPQKFISFVPKERCAFLIFIIIFLGILVIFSFLIKILSLLFDKKKELSNLEKWIALFVGIIRFSFLVSILIFVASIFPISMVKEKILANSISVGLFSKIAPFGYFSIVKLSKMINPNIEINMNIQKYYEVKRNLSKNN